MDGGGSGAEAWETVDRKLSKKTKKKSEEDDGSWSQVTNDRRKKDNQRNTLPRKQSGRDGYGAGPGAGRINRSTPSPARSIPGTSQSESVAGPMKPPPTPDVAPSKPSWANLASKSGSAEPQKPPPVEQTKPNPKSAQIVVNAPETVPIPKPAATLKPVLDAAGNLPVSPSVVTPSEPKEASISEISDEPSPTNEPSKLTEEKKLVETKASSSLSASVLNPAAPPFVFPDPVKSIVKPTVPTALNTDSEYNGNKVALDANENISVSKITSTTVPVSDPSPPVTTFPVHTSPIASANEPVPNPKPSPPAIAEPSLSLSVKVAEPSPPVSGKVVVPSSPISGKMAEPSTPPNDKETEPPPSLNSVESSPASSVKVAEPSTPPNMKMADSETRHYGRDALLQLQQHPLSLVKPERLPALDIVLDTPLRSSNSAPQLGDTPQFHQFARTLPSKRDSVRKPSKIISLSREPVKLHKSENAWTPGVKSQTEQDDLDVLSKSVLAILNKLTPQKFDVLVEKFKKLDIDTEEKLVMCMEQVFEKAVDEPSFSSAYARMCRELSLKAVTKDAKSDENFRLILLERCRKEFQADYISEEQRKKYIEDSGNAASEDEQKKIKAEFENLELKLRRRSLGNIRFISELYNLKMLPGKIMHQIIQKLLDAVDDESLESLCRLFSTSGSNLEKEIALIPTERRHLYDFDTYFNKIGIIVGNKKVSSRVRFLLQDVVDLRKMNWVSRRVESGPKTIQQIHKEAKLEALKIQLADQNLSSPVSRRSEDRNRRKTEFRPPRVQEDEGWNTAPRKAQRASDVVDPERLRNIKKVDTGSIKLGPDSGRGLSWGSGSSGPQTPAVHHANRFQMLEDSESMPAPQPQYIGRASEPIRTSYDRSLSRGRNQLGKPSSQVSSRTNSLDRSVSLRGSAAVDEEELKTKFRTLLDEYISNCDFNETLVSVCENFHPSNIDILVDVCFDYGLEKKEKDRLKCGDLIHGLMDKGCLQVNQFNTGLGRVLELAADIILDVPKFWEHTADILACVLVKSNCFVQVMENSWKCVTDQKMRENFMETVLGSVKRMNEEMFPVFISKHTETLEKLLGGDISSFLSDKKILVKASKPLQNGNQHEDLYRQISDVLDKKISDNDELLSIDRILCDRVMGKEVLRILVTAVIESVVEGVAGTQCTLLKEILHSRAPILKKYLDADKDRELVALYAIQSLVHGLQHPNKLLHTILEVLYDQDCISEDALLDWERSEDPEHQEGKGVALKSCTQFFEWLKTADEEQEEGETGTD
jgi:translation initiation factor 4G